MDTREALIDFFTNEVKSSSEFFFYKDKQLLKQGKYAEYAKEQMKKANNIALSVSAAVFYAIYYVTTSFIEYGANGEIEYLIMGLVALVFSMLTVFWAAKEYYTIKSSMTLFLKLFEDNEDQDAPVSETSSSLI